jgi:hypothetical protein
LSWSGSISRVLVIDSLKCLAAGDLKFAACALKSLNSSVEMMALIPFRAESGGLFRLRALGDTILTAPLCMFQSDLGAPFGESK